MNIIRLIQLLFIFWHSCVDTIISKLNLFSILNLNRKFINIFFIFINILFENLLVFWGGFYWSILIWPAWRPWWHLFSWRNYFSIFYWFWSSYLFTSIYLPCHDLSTTKSSSSRKLLLRFIFRRFSIWHIKWLKTFRSCYSCYFILFLI